MSDFSNYDLTPEQIEALIKFQKSGSIGLSMTEMMDNYEQVTAGSPEARRFLGDAAFRNIMGIFEPELVEEAMNLRQISHEITQQKRTLETLETRRTEIVKKLREMGMSWAKIAKISGMRQTSAQRKWDDQQAS